MTSPVPDGDDGGLTQFAAQTPTSRVNDNGHGDGDPDGAVNGSQRLSWLGRVAAGQAFGRFTRSDSPEAIADMLGKRAEPGRLSPRRGLPWLAGADARTLTLVPWERTTFTFLGIALLVPPIIGCVGLTVMLHMVTRAEKLDPRFIAAGAAWGLVVAGIDRILVKGRVKYRFVPGDDGEPFHEVTSPRMTAFLWVVRILMAVGLSVFAGEPLLAALYGKEAIEEEQNRRQTELELRLDEISSGLDEDIAAATSRAEPQRQELTEQIDGLEEQIAQLDETVATLQASCNVELTEGQSGRGAGPGNFYEDCVTNLEAALLRQSEDKPGLQDSIDDLNDEIAELDDPQDDLRDDARAERDDASDDANVSLDDLGAWQRIELTHQTVDWWYALAAIFVLLCLDSLAILAKGMLGRTTHDDLHAMASEAARTAWADRFLDVVELVRARREVRRVVADELVDNVREADLADIRRADIGSIADAGGRSTPRTASIPPTGPTAAAAAGDAGADGGAGPSAPWEGSPELDGFTICLARPVNYATTPLASGGFATIHRARLQRLTTEPEWAAEDIVIKRAHPNERIAPEMLAKEVHFYSGAGRALLDAAPEALLLPRGAGRPSLLVLRFYPRMSLDRYLFDRLPDGTQFSRRDIYAWLVTEWLSNLVDLLAQVWERGLVHGDGKPHNVLVNGPLGGPDVDWTESGYVKGAAGSLRLCDFSTAGGEGQVLAAYTPQYCPPEARRNGKLTRVGDVYSMLGGTGWFLLTGSAPPRGDGRDLSPDELRNAAFSVNPELVAVPRLVDVVAGWLHPKPRDRTPFGTSAPELVNGLRHQVETIKDTLNRGTGGLLVHTKDSVR